MFSELDGPQNRSLLVTANASDGQRYRVTLAFGRYERPRELSGQFARRLLAAPTKNRLKALAHVLLNADLAPVTAPGLPARLIRSHFYGETIKRFDVEALPPLEVAGIERRSNASVDVRSVRVVVLRQRFSGNETRVAAEIVAAAEVLASKAEVAEGGK